MQKLSPQKEIVKFNLLKVYYSFGITLLVLLLRYITLQVYYSFATTCRKISSKKAQKSNIPLGD